MESSDDRIDKVERDDAWVRANTLSKANVLTQEALSDSRRKIWDARRLLKPLEILKARIREPGAFLDVNYVRIRDMVALLREADNLEDGQLLNQLVNLAILEHKTNGPLLLKIVAIESLDNILEASLLTTSDSSPKASLPGFLMLR